jgi:hypothetical protein
VWSLLKLAHCGEVRRSAAEGYDCAGSLAGGGSTAAAASGAGSAAAAGAAVGAFTRTGPWIGASNITSHSQQSLQRWQRSHRWLPQVSFVHRMQMRVDSSPQMVQ